MRRIITDVHLFGVNPTHSVDDIISIAQQSPIPVFFIGDIVDMRNARKKDLAYAYQLLQLLAEKFHFVRGNHCLNLVNAPDFMIIDTLLLTHGDIPSFGKERSDKFRSQKPGAGWFKRNIISRPLDALRHLVAVRPNESMLRWVTDMKKQYPQVTHMVCGHSHPDKPVFFEVSGVKCVILPRGVTDITLW